MCASIDMQVQQNCTSLGMPRRPHLEMFAALGLLLAFGPFSRDPRRPVCRSDHTSSPTPHFLGTSCAWRGWRGGQWVLCIRDFGSRSG